MRLPRLSFLSLGLASVAFSVPFFALAQSSSLLGPIISKTGVCRCPDSAPDWGCLLQVVQNCINVGIALAVVGVVLVIAYAGFTFMTSSTNAEARVKGRTLVTNALIGLIVMLGAWITVDFIMKAVYDPTAAFSGQNLGPWNGIWAAKAGDECIKVNANAGGAIVTGKLDIVFDRAGVSSVVGKAGALCADSNPACSVQALKQQGLTDAQARTMSCIAVTESTGNPHTPNSNTGACGTFQITTQPGNWHIASNHGAGCSVNTSCNDAGCNLQTAVIMFNKVGYQPWTGHDASGKYWNPNAVACMNKYDPGH